MENIEYDILRKDAGPYVEDLDEIVEIMVETVCAKRKFTRVAGSDFSHEVVKSRLLKLNCDHVRFVMDCMRQNTTKIRNIKHLFAGQQAVTKEQMMAYKKFLMEKGYAASSINSMLASLNSLLDFLGRSDCKAKNIKTQRQTYCAEEKELTKSEYLRLLEAAKDRPQLHLILETICGTGIRVSELRFFTT